MNIFDHTKEYSKQRFVLAGPFDEEMPYYYLMIADYSWWNLNEPEIYSWMEANLPRGRLHQEGMVISLPTAQLATLFLLRWS
jgi:hypothetical protein